MTNGGEKGLLSGQMLGMQNHFSRGITSQEYLQIWGIMIYDCLKSERRRLYWPGKQE